MLDDAPARALRVGHHDPRGPEDPGNEEAEVVLLAWVLAGKGERQDVVDDGDLGDPRPQDPLGDRVEQQAQAIGPRPEPEEDLEPRQAHEVPEKTAAGTHHGRSPREARPQPAQRFRVGGIDNEVVADLVEGAGQVDGVDAEAGGILADDGRLDSDGGACRHISHLR